MLTAALAAIDAGDESAVVRFTREVVHLSPAIEWWSYVAQALWHTRRAKISPDNPIAYVRHVAQRLREESEASLLGPQPVRDAHRRVVGCVTVGRIVRTDGSVDEAALVSAQEDCPSDLSAMEQRKRERLGTAVLTEDRDEARLQALYLQGYTRRDAADILGWTILEAERVWDRLYRRRHAASRQESVRMR